MQPQNKKKLILGVTGSFGSGKSTVARIFKSYGAKIIDADRIAHQCIKRRTPVYKRIVATFGEEILSRSGAIDRKKLSQTVFSKKNLLKRLNSIIHPEVYSVIKRKIKQSKYGVIVLDVPLLIEAGLKKLVDKLIVVEVSQREQIARIQKKSSLSSPDIIKRIRFQIPLRLKVRLADFIIDNNGTLKKTQEQVRKIWKNIVNLQVNRGTTLNFTRNHAESVQRRSA